MKDGAADYRVRKDLRRLSAESLTCKFNLWLLAGMAFRHGVTVLILKSGDGALTQSYRPISMGPILCRLYHRILADRVEKHYRINDRQKAFRRGDGVRFGFP